MRPTEYYKNAKANPEHWKYLCGAIVVHKKFSKGKVLEVDYSTDSRWPTLKIEFDRPNDGELIRIIDTRYFRDEFFDSLVTTNSPGEPISGRLVRVTSNSERRQQERSLEIGIAERLQDYRYGEIKPIHAADVAKWADQFPYKRDEDRLVLLAEVDTLLEKYYHTRKRTKQNIQKLLNSLEEIWNKRNIDPISGIRDTNFLDVNQKYGSSQKQILTLIDEVIQEKYGYGLSSCGGSNVWVYVDDCLFSGVRLLKEIDEWLEYNNNQKRKGTDSRDLLIVWYPVVHRQGVNNTPNNVRSLCNEKNTEFLFLDKFLLIDNSKTPKSKLEFFWPAEKLRDPACDEYIQRRKTQCVGRNKERFLRPANVPKLEVLFSSRDRREIVEDLFLKAGIEAIQHLPAQEKIYPMGFDHDQTLGFGSPFISFRNIANNCPIAFWLDGKSFNYNWSPLLQRKRNFENRWWS